MRRPGLKPVMDNRAGPRHDGQTLPGDSLLVRYFNFVKLPHTIFALPFALLGVVSASFEYPVTWQTTLLVLLAFAAARFAAMGFNRIADRRLDALNPRTSKRELPMGRLTLIQAVGSVVAASLTFVIAAGLLNRVCLLLSPLALGWVFLYSYTKRFTSWSHLWLGGALAIAPAGGYLAVAGMWSTPFWTLLVLSAAVLLWVAGFDIFYSLQDKEFDRERGLKSAVVLLGESKSIRVAQAFHLSALMLLVAVGLGSEFGAVYLLGVAVAAVLLGWEHRLVRPQDLSRINPAFFTMNGIMSIVVFTAALGDRLI